MQNLAGDKGCIIEIKHRVDDLLNFPHATHRVQRCKESVRIARVHGRAYLVPEQGSSADASVEDSSVFSVGQVIFLALAGYFQVTGIPDATTLTLLNLRDDAATGIGLTEAQVFFGTGDPNGVVTATRPAVFYDDVGAVWLKTGSGTNDTGWELVIAP